MEGVIFLIFIALAWLIFASISDLKTREVPNWLSFSLIAFVLGIRFFYSLFVENQGFDFFYQGVLGLGIFFVLGNIFYYGRFFAGGDAKLVMALGTLLGFSLDFFYNLKIYLLFVFLIFLIGALYGFLWSGYLSYKNFSLFKKKFNNNIIKYKKFSYFFIVFASVFFILGLIDFLFLFYGILILFFPLVYVYAKSVDEGCMIKTISVDKLTEGDWIYEELKLGKEVLKPNWEGVSSEDIEKIKKYYKIVKIKEGVPFVPVFLISFLILIYAFFIGFLDSFSWFF